MKFTSGPSSSSANDSGDSAVPVVLFGRSSLPHVVSAGASVGETFRRRELLPSPLAWDFLSIALSIVAADGVVKRDESPDGWTREFDMQIAVSDLDIWTQQVSALSDAFAFLTTDRWRLTFTGGAKHPDPPKKPRFPATDAVALLSGGLDSLVGAIDLSAQGKRLLPISQTVRGDRATQKRFAALAGAGSEHLQLNHNANTPRFAKETSQRSRSLLFLAFATIAATATDRYHSGGTVPIYICENGFIAMNPPLTGARVGSLSTRTAHPHFLGCIQEIFDVLGLRIEIRNPYLEKTKGEMLRGCLDQDLLAAEASNSTSCGRYQRFNYTHCGRCIPCQIRRASFLGSELTDETKYVYEDLGRTDEDHAGFDDVRSVAIARLITRDEGISRWLGPSLSSPRISNRQALQDMLDRGLNELSALHTHYAIL
ncbi:7-cyano-7-deazaguanine synthase in queuosine biosynthesis [Rhodococcus sp. OAS809]|uniref:Qat anti-phage system QueC-like protein QatC n=1 Tax=Rhodococcus sp. OAS809 TaxID=2663874 RepID=UPI00178B56FE